MTALSPAETPPTTPRSPRRHPLADYGDPIFRGLCFGAATMLLAALGGVVISLVIGGWPALRKFGFGFFATTTWNPVTDVYGAAGRWSAP